MAHSTRKLQIERVRKLLRQWNDREEGCKAWALHKLTESTVAKNPNIVCCSFNAHETGPQAIAAMVSLIDILSSQASWKRKDNQGDHLAQ